MSFPSIIRFDKLAKAQSEANELLQGAMLNERAASWNKVVDKYKRMLKLVAKCNLPASFISPPSYSRLMYESYYHLAVALQNLGRHKEAIHAYSNAILSMNLRKNGCTAGCNSNSCFHTPILARRAFAHAKTGDIKSAFRDVEKAVVLDTHNPDLYCVRAILWNNRKESQKAMEDLDRALTFNRNHVCALILRGATDRPLQMTFGLLEGISTNVKKELHADHKLALELNPDASSFVDIVPDVHGPKMMKFWSRFLWSLSVPRSVMYVDLTSSVIAQYNNTIVMTEKNDFKATPSFGHHRPMTASTPSATKSRVRLSVDSISSRPQSNPLPFRCGTPQESTEPPTHSNMRGRRLSYGEAIRTYTARKQDTGVSDYIQRLVAHASRPPSERRTGNSPDQKIPTITVSRSPDVTKQPSRSESRNSCMTNVTPTENSPPVPSPPKSITTLQFPSRRGSHVSIKSCPVTINRPVTRSLGDARLPPSGVRRASVAGGRYNNRDAAGYASSIHGLEVFNTINISDVPRMYYKPWGGDKLPVAELPARKKIEAFRV